MADPLNLTVATSPTQTAFVESTADENLLVGPRGEGKSVAGAIAMTYHAERQPSDRRPIPWVIIRDTFENLKNTTLKAIMRSPIGPALKLSDASKKLTFPGLWEADLYGVDSLGDISKLQGAELGGLWFEECAPAAEGDIGSGIQSEAYEVGLTSLRYKCKTRAQITQNYPDEDHWTWQRFVENIDQQLSIACFRIPRFENPHISAEDRKKWLRQLKNRPDLAKRLILGEPGFVQLGLAVTPEFDSELHVSKQPLEPFFENDLYMGWDFGLNPTLTIIQPSPLGYLHVLDCIVGYGMSLKDMILKLVKPRLAERYPWLPQYYIHIPDPAGNTREQSTGNTAWGLLESLFPGDIHPAEQWPAARESVKSALNRKVEDRRWIIIDPKNCKPLIAALRGGWHYKKLPTGHILRDKPVKDKYSHPADSFAGMIEPLRQIFNIEKKRVRRTGSNRGKRQPMQYDHLAGDLRR